MANLNMAIVNFFTSNNIGDFNVAGEDLFKMQDEIKKKGGGFYTALLQLGDVDDRIANFFRNWGDRLLVAKV